MTQTDLSTAAIAVDGAGGPRVQLTADEAGALWCAIVDGRWSLVDHFDRGGRRYLVARPNPSRLGAGLNERERRVLGLRAQGQAFKLIAFELGLSLATVARDLARARRKLGLRTQGDLARLLDAPAARPPR